MTDQQRLVLQEKAAIHLTKPLYVQQVSLTKGPPAVRGIANPALCALFFIIKPSIRTRTVTMYERVRMK